MSRLGDGNGNRANSPGGRWPNCAGWLIPLVFLLPAIAAKAESSAANLPLFTGISPLKRLTPEDASRHYPVRVSGVVTYFDQVAPNLFIQDGPDGIWVRWNPKTTKPAAGDLVEIEGTTSQNGFAPFIEETSLRLAGHSPLPEPVRPTLEQMSSSMEDSRRVEVEGIVRSVSVEVGGGRLRITLAVPGGEVLVQTPNYPSVPSQLVDATVRLRGVCGAIFNPRLQIIGIVIHMPSLSELQVIGAAPADPFSMAVRPINSLQRFMQGASGHRTHVRGVVTAYFPNQEFFISDRTGGLFVRTRDRMPLEPGDQVDVAGFPSIVDDRAALVDATFHRTAGGTPPAPLLLTAGEALVGEHDSALVEIEGELGAISPVGNDKVLVLHQAGTTFTARVRAADPEVMSLREGSRVRLTGICLVQYDLLGNPLALNLRLRSGRDIVVTRRASWLTTGRALSILGFLAIAIVLALTWIAILRRRVQKQTEIIRTTLESTGDGILVADSRRIPMAYNQRFVEMWRIPKPVLNARDEQSLLKFTLSQVKDPDGYLAKVDSLYDNGEAQADDVIEFSDGRVIEYHSEPLRIGGTPQGRVWGFRDITDRKRAEEKILRYSNDLAKANEELKRFTYIASHDLRAPLISLKGFSAELRESLDTIRQPVENALPAMADSEREAVRDAIRVGIPEALDFIESSATRMDHLINALLKLSRLGHREFRMEELNMRELVQLTVDALAHQIETRGAEIKIGALPVAVADRTAMEQIFGNLLNNAVVYLDGKRTGKIEVYAQETYDELVFYVRDNGRGIAADDMDKVFAPFRRAGHQDVPGEGMGLAYVQVLVNRLGGQIRCESEASAGTTFSFSLPKSKEKINSHG